MAPSWRLARRLSRPNGASQLTQLALSVPRAWPESGNAARTAAIKALGVKYFDTEAPRTQYYSLTYTLATWTGYSKALGTDELCDNVDDTEPDAMTWARCEPKKEIGWLITEHDYAETLVTPFVQSAFASASDLQKIATAVNDEVSLPATAKVQAETKAIFDFARGALKELPIIGKAFAFGNEIYNFSSEISKIEGEPVESPFASTGTRSSPWASRPAAAR